VKTKSQQDTKTFQNPIGYWEHDGAFSVELTPDADKSIVPSTAEIQGDIVRVRNGRVKQTMGGIQLHSEGNQFYWGYPRIKAIRDGKDNLLWINNNYR
jgi:hypothetical protein